MVKIRDFVEILQLLAEPRGVSYQELMKKREFGYRTAQRVIAQASVICQIDEMTDFDGKTKRFYISEENLHQLKFPNIEFSFKEIVALLLLKGQASVLKNSEYEDALNKAFEKLFTISSTNSRKLEILSDLLMYGENHPKIQDNEDDILTELFEALLNKFSCDVNYESFAREKIMKYQIDPLHLFQRDGGLYLFARIHPYDNIVTLAVERIKTFAIANKHFEYPENFNPQEYLDNSFLFGFGELQTFKIKFSATQAKYIKERQWVKEQIIHTLEDGSIILEMKSSSYYDIKRWIMSYGSDAELLEPVEMREEIKQDIKEMQKLY